jgi:hypothetical protein
MPDRMSPGTADAALSEVYSKAIAGRSRATRKYSNRYWMTRT